MDPRQPNDLEPRSSVDLAEVQEQIHLWSSKAAELLPSVIAFANALGSDASQILFKGDMIVFNASISRDLKVGPLSLDLATIRRIVCNLKMLEAQRQQKEASEARANYDRDTVLTF